MPGGKNYLKKNKSGIDRVWAKRPFYTQIFSLERGSETRLMSK